MSDDGQRRGRVNPQSLSIPDASRLLSSLAGAAIWAVLYGHRDFVCLIGSDEGHAMAATLGRKDFEADTLAGRLYFRASDFLIPAASLVLDGQTVLPERGDRIEVAFGAATVVFEVLAHDGVPPWEYADPHQHMLRIHAKRIE